VTDRVSLPRPALVLAAALALALVPLRARAFGLSRDQAGKLLRDAASVEIVRVEACDATGCEGPIVEAIRGRAAGTRVRIEAACDPRLAAGLAGELGRDLLVIGGTPPGCPSTIAIERDGRFVLSDVDAEEYVLVRRLYAPPFVERESIAALANGQEAAPIRMRAKLRFVDEPDAREAREALDATFSAAQGRGEAKGRLLGSGSCDASLDAGMWGLDVGAELTIDLACDGSGRSVTLTGRWLGRAGDGAHEVEVAPWQPILRTPRAFRRWLAGNQGPTRLAEGVIRVREGAPVASGEYPVTVEIDAQGVPGLRSPLFADTTIGLETWSPEIHGLGVSLGEHATYPMVLFELSEEESARGPHFTGLFTRRSEVTIPVSWLAKDGARDVATPLGDVVLRHVPDEPWRGPMGEAAGADTSRVVVAVALAVIAAQFVRIGMRRARRKDETADPP
jgi:hypothetical protein